MRIIKTSNFKKDFKKKKKWNPNPWAVCFSKIDKKKNPEKAERCIMHVKEKQKDCKDCKTEEKESSTCPDIIKKAQFGQELPEQQKELDEQIPSEPEEGDITTEDHQNWFQYEKLYFQGDEKGLLEKMNMDKFWPDVWFISDHGNAHLITNLLQ
jgi:hypothetical protein